MVSKTDKLKITQSRKFYLVSIIVKLCKSPQQEKPAPYKKS